MMLKLGGPLDFEVVQGILFRGTIYQILIESLFFKDCSDMTSFPATSYSFHQIGLKLGRQLDLAVVH